MCRPAVYRAYLPLSAAGKFAGASGEVREVVIGSNALGCFNLRFQFSLKESQIGGLE